MRQFFGKYRGTVENNIDPKMLGRVQVSVPGVLEGRDHWAEPCVPYAGSGVGLYAVPPKGAAVWVEFEAGNPHYPILAGARWETGQLPKLPILAPPQSPAVKVWKTDAVTITLSDIPGKGGLTIEVGKPAVPMPIKLSMTATGLELSMGKSSIVLDGASVSINKPALVVT